jgi:ArsR family transcriptional regulator
MFALAFQALSEPTRLLSRARKELCVCEFVDALEEPQYHISRSLKILQNAGLITERREGRWVYYGLPSESDEFRQSLLRAVAALPQSVVAKDERELARRLKLREGGKCLSGVQKVHLLSRDVARFPVARLFVG